MGPMISVASARRYARALLSALALQAAAPAAAAGAGTDLFSSETISISSDFRLVGVDGERAWLDDGFGKLRFGASEGTNRSDFHVEPEFGEANLVWRPRLSWAVSGTIVAAVQNKDGLDAGLSEAFLSFKPLSGGKSKFSARAGLMWPAISLEHSGPEWAVTETITPSAINSWVGEEVKVVGAEASLATEVGGNKLSATAGIFDFNDTAGTLLAFRGWALHDEKAMAFKRQPLPPLNGFIQYVQPRFSHPLIDIDYKFLKHPGFYAKLAWEAPFPLRLEAIHYDNRADPEAVNADLEWGWRTKFDNIGAVLDLNDNLQLRTQGMAGHTRMGVPENGVIWVDTRFRSAYLLLTRHFERGSVSGRIEAFGTRNRGSTLTSEDDEDGWAVTLAARRGFGKLATGLIELLHVESDRAARERAGIAPKQSQTQLQMALRVHW